jgi:hypothetical protein
MRVDGKPGDVFLRWSGGKLQFVNATDGSVIMAVDPIGKIVDLTLAAGAIQTADIANESVTSAKLPANSIQVATVSLTNAEIKALNTSPKVLVAAPGAGKFIEFLGATLFHDYGSEALTGNHALTIGLNNGAVAVAAAIAHGDFAHKAADHVFSVKAAVAFNDTAANALNKNLALLGAGNYAGNASNDTVWTIHVAYRVIDFS